MSGNRRDNNVTGSVKKHVKQAIPAYVILIVIFVVMSMVSPSFRKIGNYRNIVAQTAVLAIVSIAQCNVLLSSAASICRYPA